MLPGTIVYVYLGEQLAEISSITDIVSPTILVAFSCLGLLPLLMKKLVDFLRRWRANEKV